MKLILMSIFGLLFLILIIILIKIEYDVKKRLSMMKNFEKIKKILSQNKIDRENKK